MDLPPFIGGAVKHISNMHKYIRDEDVPENTIFIIITDGMENASHKYSADKVKKMIKDKKKQGWEFLFIGANIDAVTTAESFGIDKSRAVDYHADAIGTATVFTAVTENISYMRKNNALSDDWADDIKKDYKSRK